jgi:hypothetical protein
MSVINTNQFAAGFASTSVHQEFENAGGAAPEYAAGFPQPSDNIQYGSYGPSLPIQSPAFNAGAYGANPSTGSSGGFDFSSILNQIGNLISGLFQQLGSMFANSQPGNGTPQPGTPASPQPAGSETYFANSTSSSTGDPHLAFDGTTGAGATVSDKWNSMSGHGNLLSSDSFNGGYRVSTQTTAPNSAGIAYNGSATVTTDAGAAAVTMNKDGSYSVTQNGQDVSLTQGQATSLGNGETVTLNTDGSLTVADANGSGGTLSTTLTSHGSYVDVSNAAHDVDLGGYLVHHTDNDALPVAQAAPPFHNGGSVETGGQIPYQSYQLPMVTPGYQPQPMVTGLEQFDPDQGATGLDSIELG